MAVGGGSTAVLAIVLMLFLVVPRDMVDAASYLVGDKVNGWNFNISNWPKAKTFTFKPGDELVFTYEAGKHNVVPVNTIEYDFCGHALDSKVYSSGNDKITLVNGSNYFISDFPNQCESGMKLRVFAK